MDFPKDWPYAINPSLICRVDSEKDKLDRAEAIVELLVNKNLTGTKFLDYGCGEGHVVEVLKDKCFAVGYDLSPVKFLGNYFNDWERVQEYAPYDSILLYDVLDHTDDPIESLRQVAQVCDNKSRVYVRCHPWIGRHGGHLYQTHNLAFAHLFLEETSESPKQKVITPLGTYRKWFETAGFEITKTVMITDNVEPIILQNGRREIINSLLTSTPRSAPAEGWPKFQMSLTFVDYVLKLA